MKQIPSFPDYYADEQGDIYRLKSVAERKGERYRKRKAFPNRLGHYRIVITLDGKRFYKSVHRLVWEAFNGPIPDDMMVRHLNDIQADNRPCNLALGNAQQNAQDKFRNWRNYKNFYLYALDNAPELVAAFNAS